MLTSFIRRYSWLHGLIDFAFPPLCCGCAKFTEAESGICDSCNASIDTLPVQLCLSCFGAMPRSGHCDNCGGDSIPLFAYGSYAPPLKDIILQFKFHGITRLAAVFAERLSKQFGDSLRSMEPAVLVPVPLHVGRENSRGYNQASLIARRLGESLGMAVAEDLLIRSKKRRPQSKLSPNLRVANVKNVFTCIRVAEENTPDVILVDDVVTSGATLREARSCMEKSGYRVTATVAVAHGGGVVQDDISDR